jgi:CBS domain-containing protein
MNVDELMTRDVMTCSPEDFLNAAARILWDRDCGCVPVIEQEDDGARVVGMLTDRDICMAAYTQGLPLAAIKVSSAMAREVRACRATDPVPMALRILHTNQLHRLPVLDADEHLIGLLSLADVAREAAHERARGAHEVTDAQVAETVESISEPRAPHTMTAAA